MCTLAPDLGTARASLESGSLILVRFVPSGAGRSPAVLDRGWGQRQGHGGRH